MSRGATLPAFTRRERLIVFTLALAIFSGTLNVYLLTPFLKLIAADFHVTEGEAGQLATTYALAAGLVGLMVAPLVDRYQRKRLLYLAVTVIMCATVLTATAHSFAMLLFAHGLAGFGAAFGGSSCLAIASDAFPDLTKRNRCLGILISSGGVSAVVGVPILTHIAAAESWRWAVAAFLVPCALAAIFMTQLPGRNTTRRTSFVRDYLASYRRVLRNGETRWLYLAILAGATAETAPLIYSAPIWNGLFDLSLTSFGWLFLLGGISYAVGSNLAPMVMRRFPARPVCIASGVVQLGAALCFPVVANSLLASLVLYACFIVTIGAIGAVSMNVLLQDSLPADRGAVLSLSGFVLQSGNVCAAVFGAVILAKLGEVAVIPVISLALPVGTLALWRSGLFQPVEPAEAVVLEPVEPSLS